MRDVSGSSEKVVGIDHHSEHERNEPFVPVQIEDQTKQDRDREVRGG
jgi:hypothetical protein